MGNRLFVSVDLDGLADGIAAVQDRFSGASGLNFVDPEGAHVTLKFLGDTDPDRLDDLTDELASAVDDAGVDPFECEFGGLGVFPSLDYISVVWVGTRSGGEELTRLHEAVEERTTTMGFDAEDHDFTPHVTIGRMDHAGGKELVQERVREDDPGVGRLAVEEIRVKESVLGPDGPTYDTVERLPL
ncbi:RNA 2',3'-cyclic phosphodiesterase [Halosimplex litoreum]|uniref:RNA 2',3'-cyclic phosphodiesterase n=1 Tax=Halosimplex litoreum TaxID=1198301 RepID=A0A7T3G134_9EURY|nr:RNA 2',3'-cyclic phosphodiesterase [Halosimplex litoreum]QPV64446.1 RNA 2',3'-cyclic phosphodiesterase [Halosimplex litoreum]